MRKRLYNVLLLAITMAGLTIETPAAAEEPEIQPAPRSCVIQGRVVDDKRQVLPGATLIINEAGVGTVSDVNGFYRLTNIEPGTMTLKVSYIGYQEVTLPLTLCQGEICETDIILCEGIGLEEVVVTSALSGQRKAINMQKNAMGVSHVVSADQVGKFPDSNIGDALKRISGINVQYDMGEARFGQVRGTAADLSSVSVNGNRMPSAEGDTRNVQLDLIPADMVQMIEVNKVVTSDMDGDAIGGAINLVTKNTPYDRLFNFTLGSGYNIISNKPNLNLGATYGDRFFKDRLGLMVALSYQNSPNGADNVEFSYDADDQGNIFLDKAEVRQYYVTRERQSYSLAADWKFNANHTLSFKGIYNRRNDWENRYRITYKKLGEKPEKQSVVLQTKGGSEDNRNSRVELQQTLDLELDGRHNFGPLSMDWGISYAAASEDRPEERYFGVTMKGKKNEAFFSGMQIHDAGGRKPYIDHSPLQIAGYNWEMDELTNQNQEISEKEWKGRINFELPLSTGDYGNKLRFGAKHISKEKQREVHCYDFSEAYEAQQAEAWKGHLTQEIREGFMAGSSYPTGLEFVDKSYLGNLSLDPTSGDCSEILAEAAANYIASESITGAYLRFDQQLGQKVELVAGLRMEHTRLSYQGNNYLVDDPEQENGRLEPTDRVENHYTNWLPSLLVKYNISDQAKLRASFTKTLSRPKYSDLVPCIHYNVADEEAMFGNPNLNPITSYNFDLSGEYYFESVGLISGGFFYKRINDMIAEERWKSSSEPGIPEGLLNEDGEPARYEISRPINAYDVNLMGVELSWQRDFGFITPALRALGLYATYTYTHSRATNLKFEHRSTSEGETIRMSGSPEHTANLSLYFEKSGFNARLSYNYASAFVDEYGLCAELDTYYDSTHYLDLNLGYTFGKQYRLTIYAELNNLLNQPLRYYAGTPERTIQAEYYGLKASAGVKFRF